MPRHLTERCGRGLPLNGEHEIPQDVTQFGEVGLVVQVNNEPKDTIIDSIVHQTGDNALVLGDHLIFSQRRAQD